MSTFDHSWQEYRDDDTGDPVVAVTIPDDFGHEGHGLATHAPARYHVYQCGCGLMLSDFGDGLSRSVAEGETPEDVAAELWGVAVGRREADAREWAHGLLAATVDRVIADPTTDPGDLPDVWLNPISMRGLDYYGGRLTAHCGLPDLDGDGAEVYGATLGDLALTAEDRATVDRWITQHADALAALTDVAP